MSNGKGLCSIMLGVFNEVTSKQVMFLSTEGTGHVKPSQCAILKYYYLSLSSIPPSFLWVGAAQGNHGSDEQEKNEIWIMFTAKGRRKGDTLNNPLLETLLKCF